MKKFLTISVLLSIGFVLGVSWKELTANAAGGGVVPVGNGDVNGDGKIDLSDAIYTLTWLFLGGPAAAPIECPPPAKRDLPPTGQTNCYNAGGAKIACDNANFPGQDGFYQTGCPSEGRFVGNGDGTVTDTCTGRMWQEDTSDVSGNGTIGDEDRLYWQDALRYCEDLDLAGHDDWRLPNVKELQSIVDYGHFKPAIDTTVFGAKEDWYWSSSSIIESPDIAWVVSFDYGDVTGGGGTGGRFFVRAVRNAP